MSISASDGLSPATTIRTTTSAPPIASQTIFTTKSIISSTYMTNEEISSPVESGPNDITTFVIIGAIIAAVVFIVFVCFAVVVIIVIVIRRKRRTSGSNIPVIQRRIGGINETACYQKDEQIVVVEMNMQETEKTGTHITDLRNSISTFHSRVPMKETEMSESSTEPPQKCSIPLEVEGHEQPIKPAHNEIYHEISNEKISPVASDSDTVTDVSKSGMDDGNSTDALNNGTSMSVAPETHENNLEINK